VVVVDEFFPGPPWASATPVSKPIAATPTSRCLIMVFLREESGSHETRRWRKTDSNSRSHRGPPASSPSPFHVRAAPTLVGRGALPDLLAALSTFGIGAQPMSRPSRGIPRRESVPSRGRCFADVRRMHQAGWLVKHISRELESELFKDFLRSTIVRVMPGVDLRQPQFFAGVLERAERCFRWAVAFVIGAVLWPFVSVYLRETTGSFVAAFLLIPIILLVMAGVIWLYSPEHARKELDSISVTLSPFWDA
jgi:hypothetical protein